MTDNPASVPGGILFVEADEPLLVFHSVAEAENGLKPMDVEQGLYPAAYGPNGETYRLSVAGRRVAVERTSEPDRPGALKELLLRYFDGCEDPADATEPLESLVARAWDMESGHRERCGSRARTPVIGYVVLAAVSAVILYFALR